MNNYQSFPPNGHYQHQTGSPYSPRTFSPRNPRGFSPHHGYPGPEGSSPRHYISTPGSNYGPFSQPPSPRKTHFNSPAFHGRFTSPNDMNRFRTPNSSQSPGWIRSGGRKSFTRQVPYHSQSPGGIESYYYPGMVDDPWKNCDPVPVSESQATAR